MFVVGDMFAHQAHNMTKEPLLSFIRSNTPNVPVQEQALFTIADQFELRLFKKGDYLLEIGKVSEYIFLAEGFLRTFTFDENGEEVTTYFYHRDRMVYDAASFFLSIPSTENIQAITDGMAFITKFSQLNQLFHTVPEFREFGRQMLVKEFVAYKQRTLAMINKAAEERYVDLLETNREIFQHAPLRQIASYLGISERTLNRIRSEGVKK